MGEQKRTIELTREIRAESMFSRLVRFNHNGLAFVGLCFLTSGMQDTWQAIQPRLAAAASATQEQPAEKEQLEGNGIGALAWCAMHYEGKKSPKNPEGTLIDGTDALAWCGTYYAKFKQKVEKQLGGTR